MCIRDSSNTVDSEFHVCGCRIPHPWLPDSISGWIPDFEIVGFRIPKQWIPDSDTDQNYLDSGLLWPIKKRRKGESRERKARHESKCVEDKRTKTYPPSPNHRLFRGKLTNAIWTKYFVFSRCALLEYPSCNLQYFCCLLLVGVESAK